MMVLWLLCALVFALCFGLVAFLLRPSPEQRKVQGRLEGLLTPSLTKEKTSSLDTLLRVAPQAQDQGLLTGWQQVIWMRRLAALVYQSTGKRAVGPVLLTVVVVGFAVFSLVDFLTGMTPIAALAAALLGAAPLVRLQLLRQRRIRNFENSLPDCIDMCARALRAGHSLIGAIGMVAEQAPEPARSEFAAIFNKQNYGLPIRDALLETLERIPSTDFRVFSTGILVQKDTGGNLTEIFDRIVMVIRERIRIQGDVRVHTAQGRMTAWILTLLPILLLLVINLLNPGYSRPMFDDPLGRKLLYLGAFSLLAGGISVRRIVNGIEV